MNFHDIQFPAALSFGSMGGPERRTEIVTLSNGFEERNTAWAHSRRRYDAGVGLRALDDVDAVLSFFEARRGQMYGFRWKDWADFKSCKPSQSISPADQVLGQGDGIATQFQLSKTYASGGASYVRPITKPVAGSVVVQIGAQVQVPAVDFTLNLDTGTIVFASAPSEGVTVSAGFEFDVPVRFDTDRIHSSMASFQAGEVPAIPVVEVRL